MRKVFSFSVFVDDLKLAGKKHNIDPMWKVLNKEVDLGEDNYRNMFESRISAEGLEKLPFLQSSYFLMVL